MSPAGGMKLEWKAVNRDNYYPSHLYRPHGLAFLNSDLVVAEGFWPYSRIHLFNINSGRPGQTSEQQCILPHDVTACDENIAFTDHQDRTVKFMSLTDCTVTGSWQKTMFDWPTGIAYTDGRFYVSDWYRGMIYVVDKYGTTVSSFSSGTNEYSSLPVALTVDNHRRIIVANSRERSINILDDAGNLLWSSINANLSNAISPRGVCVDERDNIIISDWEANVIKKFDCRGMWFSDLLDASDGINHPWGVAIGSNHLLGIIEQKLADKPSVKLYTML